MRIDFKKMLAVMLIAVMMVSSVAFAVPVSLEGKVRDEDTMARDWRTYISTDALRHYGLSAKISGDTIQVYNGEVKFTFKKDSNLAVVNKTSVTFDGKAFVENGKGYVPLRLIFEAMNYTVSYDEKSKGIVLSYNGNFVFPITIQDGDLSYRFTKPARRIVSLAPSITEILFAIGAGDCVVGRTKYCDYPAEAEKVQSVGTLYEPDLEGILDLEPDMAIAATHMNKDVIEALSKAGIATLTQASPEKIDEIYTLILQLGFVTNRTYESRAVVSTMKAKEDRIQHVVRTLADKDQKQVYYVVSTGKAEYTAGKNTFIHQVLTEAGLDNVAADTEGWAYSLEKLLDHDPEYLLGAEYSLKTMKESPNYAGLTALKKDQFVVVDVDVISIPGPRIIEAIKGLMQKMYPQRARALQF